MVYGDANFINAEDKIIGKFNAKQTNYEKLRTGFVHIPQQAAFWKKRSFKKIFTMSGQQRSSSEIDFVSP